ncbi:class I SAM-dependent methyltransferase [Myxococcota bacterium]|nr:class I SAM-dependent methyltransferase [Myxococcota bacterium]
MKIQRTQVGATIATGLLILMIVSHESPAQYSGPESKPSRRPDIVYVGTPHDVVRAMLRLAQLHREDVVYDLGCGDARILIAAAKQYGTRGVGFEIDPEVADLARRNVRANGLDGRIRIEERDIYEVDLAPADVIMVYLLPRLVTALVPAFEQLRPGSRIVSHDAGIHGIPADEVVVFRSREDSALHTISLWTTPLGARKDSKTPHEPIDGVRAPENERGVGAQRAENDREMESGRAGEI